jgi:hypothetical protein
MIRCCDDRLNPPYNRIRRHSSIGMQSPMRFEKLHQHLTTAA